MTSTGRKHRGSLNITREKVRTVQGACVRDTCVCVCDVKCISYSGSSLKHLRATDGYRVIYWFDCQTFLCLHDCVSSKAISTCALGKLRAVRDRSWTGPPPAPIPTCSTSWPAAAGTDTSLSPPRHTSALGLVVGPSQSTFSVSKVCLFHPCKFSKRYFELSFTFSFLRYSF